MPDLAKETPGGESLPATPSAKNAAKSAPASPYAPPITADEADALLAKLEPKAMSEAGVSARPHDELRAFQQLAGALRTAKKFLKP